ncbi:MAG: HAMP domain-containing histidine kinase [Nitrosopumilus sp.]|uniref:sensor histidine kinase n=1 Tax=Nitrosopumilus sp. TaxID=2024843 RepID=UPI00247C4A4F|nr:HAMP domain-containing sensor histidine kinase [Nitrosopumilus sp.]MCV0393061.1 HAMP domain-containing histidine kinase [Nitrosopumilus sp.]
MSPKQKISIIVGFQILLIAGSFMTMVYLESKWTTLGNTIDQAGLNRLLTLRTILEIHNFEDRGLNFDTQTMPKVVSLESLKENLYLIKEGGIKDGISLVKLPEKLQDTWYLVEQDYVIFESSIKNYFNSDSNERHELLIQIDTYGENLIQSSDNLVSDIALFQVEIEFLIISLQIIFLIVNVIAHVLLVYLIFKILNNFSNEKIKLEKFAVIGEIGANIAHDLRNPLAAIKGSFDILKMKKKDLDDEFAEKQFKKIETSINKIQYLTRDILDFARNQEIQKEEFSLLESIKDTMNEIPISKQVQIKLPENDYKIIGDKVKIGSVISNLIKNSVDEVGNTGSIRIDLKENPQSVVITIEDSGKRLTEKDVKKIFDPLYTTKQHGTGLGLTICQKIIEQHEGTINVKVNPTRFIISLPKK